MKEKQEVNIFISSPNNMRQERDLVEEVVGRLNENLSDRLGVFLRVMRWEKLIPTATAGNIQEKINELIGPYDIFLGIMGNHFGTPTSNFESGTLEEFEIAYDSWMRTGVPEIMFYFRKIKKFSPDSSNSDDIEQLLKVKRFRDKLGKMVIYGSYEEINKFKDTLRDDLEKKIEGLIQKVRSLPEANSRESHPFKYIDTVDIKDIENVWNSLGICTSFAPGNGVSNHRFYRTRIETTAGWIQNKIYKKEKVQQNFVTIIKDPIRPFDIQIGETRSLRQEGNPMAISDLANLDLNSVIDMYPLLQVKGYKWIRMVLAELATDQNILDFIYDNDNDPQIKNIAAKNPSASSKLQEKGCRFCEDEFRFKRNLQSGSDKTFIINNDYPYGPYFHYIAFPARPVHSWEELSLTDIVDMNLTILKFLDLRRNANLWIPKPSGVFIGLNSSIRHLVIGKNTRTSAGASIPHIHKQIWGMAPGSVNLGDHLHNLCSKFQVEGGYLQAYYEFLQQEDMVIFEDDNVVLYVPCGQISVHELQIMVKKSGKSHYLSLTEDEVRSFSKAEAIAVKLLKEIGIKSFNEVIITLPFNTQSPYFRLIMCFVTREIDLAVSELNHLFVVDKYPEDTRDLIKPIKDRIIKNVEERPIKDQVTNNAKKKKRQFNSND